MFGNLPRRGSNTTDGSITFPKISASAIASQAEAQAGAVSNKLMTPLRVAQAIIAQVVDATTAIKGRVALSTAALVQAGVDALTAVTPAALATVLFGIGQTLQDVTASRALATTYTNGTTKPIEIFVVVAVTGGAQTTLLVNGSTIAAFTPPSGSATFSFIAMIPPGFTYRVATGSGSITSWNEIR